MSEPIKIALTGKLRSGKDTVAWQLFSAHNFEPPIAFAGMMKYFAHKVYAHTPMPDGKPRAMYQAFGEACRQFDPDVWIRHAEFAVNLALEKRSTTGVVIADLRLPREYEWCLANGFTIIRVTAPDEQRMGRAVDAGDDFTVRDFAHETESHVDGFAVDYEIANDGTVDDLKRKVDEMVDEIKRRWAVE